LDIHESPQYKSFIADKIKLRDYSKRILGKVICVPLLKIYDNPYEINFEDLPNKFVIKYNHGSGMNIICENKNEINIEKITKILKKWKNINYGLRTTEFQYIYIKRRILIEEFLTSPLVDYKIYCFNGKPEFILAKKIINKKDHIVINNYYNVDWKLNELETYDFNYINYIRDPNYKIKKPKKLKLMLKYSKLLSKEFVFVRVDLYDYNNTIYLGELTFIPNNGFKKWKSKTDNMKIAKLIDITKIKPYLFNK